nr:DBF4-type zinc finger-containing protein 2 [Zootoca vivipara]XP_034993898.1 DBF4-type zinc finger-containing protein 2 [Zootoca vivipara]XP_034993907.1 DBF4-type zinc finger-containing protein 2 [Zootoca vivipara]XP_034993916.1 DBF4-type zinc finger-containing protein 2 [Zootoca vivipara]XP_034993926.1 DBF4-type zinc finger-containing protein 2 [Zootoca vivipara]
MFDRNKQADEASAASAAQDIERRGDEGSLQQERGSSTQVPELAGAGLPVIQNRQGYCNCCHVHYSNLEQHVSSTQHRHFATYCRNRTGTTSLMERFLQDVLRHHPYRYHDNRPTYDDIPISSSQPLSRIEPLLPVEVLEKEGALSQREEPSADSAFTAESGWFTSQRSQEEPKEAPGPVTLLQTLEERGQVHSQRTSQQTIDISSSTRNHVAADGTLTESSSHKTPLAAVNPLPCPSSISHSPPPPILEKYTMHSVIPDLASQNRCEQTKQSICDQDELLPPNLSPIFQFPQSTTVSHSQESPVCNQGNSLISGQVFLKQGGLQAQDETQISDFCLRDTSNPVGTGNLLSFQAASQFSGGKENQLSRSAGTSVDEITGEVVLSYCSETPPQELPRRDEETNPCVNILSLLDHNSVHGSDVSFDCDANAQSGAHLPEAAVKNLELLKEVQVNLQDEKYGSQLSSILQNNSVQQTAEAEADVSDRHKEPVLPALPHVPPSFVGKTWSQIMYEDDLKIEALVRDFREGRFRCYFNSKSLANGATTREKKEEEEEGKISAIAAEELEAVSDNGLLEFGSDFSNSPAASETQHIPEAVRKPQKRTWRLASRCQVVKVSRGTQTSLLNYPIAKQKTIRRDHEQPNPKGYFVWSENEKTPTMKTRLCALKLPESYTKILNPLQPQTTVYVLSCPEMKPARSNAEDIPKTRRCYNLWGKDSIRYKYKQTSIKYYDPLTNRVLKTPPRSVAGEKAKKASHVRQLFRSLSLDANGKKRADTQYECIAPKSFNSPDFNGSSTPLTSDPVKEKDKNSSHKTDDSSVSPENECLVCSSSEKSYKNLVLSPLNSHQSQQDSDLRLTPFNRKEVQSPLASRVAVCLKRVNTKTLWQRRKDKGREPGFSKKAAGLAIVRRSLIRRGIRKQPPRTTTQAKEGGMRKIYCAAKSFGLSISRHQTKKATIAKHLKKEKLDAKKLKVTSKPKRTFLNDAAIVGVDISEERQQGTTQGLLPK